MSPAGPFSERKENLTHREEAERRLEYRFDTELLRGILHGVLALGDQHVDPEAAKWDKARKLADDLLGERAARITEKDIESEAERLAAGQDPAQLYKILPVSQKVIFQIGQNEGAWQRSHELAALLRDAKKRDADLPYPEAVGDLLQAVREWLRGYGEEI